MADRVNELAIRPDPLNVISVCSGGAGLDLGLELAVPNARTVCMVERESFAVATLVAAMQDGLLAPAPIWSDVRTFDGRPWRGLVDGLIGGIPCQPHSHAGRKQGQLDERDLWSPTRRIIVQARPWFVLIENVSGMLSAGDDEVAGAERVRRGLRQLGYAYEGGLFTASEVGPPHDRERFFILGVNEALANDARRRWSSGELAAIGRRDPGPHRSGGVELANAGRGRRGARDERDMGAGPEGRGAFPSPSDQPLADADRDGHEGGQPPRSPEAVGRRSGDGSDALADAGQRRLQRLGRSGVVLGETADAEGEGDQRQRSWLDAGDGDEDLADAGGAGLEGRELGGSSRGVDGRAASGPAPEFRGACLVDAESERWGEGRAESAIRSGRPAAAVAGGAMGDAARARGRPIPVFEGRQDEADADADRPGLFPPGPGDAERWRFVLDRAPQLEPSFRRMADGVAPELDFARIDRLRMLGNGVVPLQGGYAFRSLATALARTSAGASLLVRLMELE